MSVQFHAAVSRLDSLLRRHFLKSGKASSPLLLDVIDGSAFDGPKATFNRSFGSLHHRRWFNSVNCIPEWLSDVAMAVTELAEATTTRTQAVLHGEFLTREWVQSWRLSAERRMIEYPSVENPYGPAWELTANLHQYEPCLPSGKAVRIKG